MRIIRGWQGLSGDDRGASIALGNFDGVHRGHQAVIGLAAAAARDLGAPLGVVSFDPHPRRIFQPDAPAFVKVGDTVAEGQTLMIVEAMKTMNHIPAPRAGTVRRVLVDDGTPVEFGTPLMIVE